MCSVLARKDWTWMKNVSLCVGYTSVERFQSNVAIGQGTCRSGRSDVSLGRSSSGWGVSARVIVHRSWSLKRRRLENLSLRPRSRHHENFISTCMWFGCCWWWWWWCRYSHLFKVVCEQLWKKFWSAHLPRVCPIWQLSLSLSLTWRVVTVQYPLQQPGRSLLRCSFTLEY